MGNIVLIVIALLVVVFLFSFIRNKRKEKNYEATLAEEAYKTKKLYKGILARYVDRDAGTTILRYFISGKTNTLTDFVPTDELLVNDCLVLFDKQREKLSIIHDIWNHGVPKTIAFSDVISLQPVEVSKTKKVTRGGISPISIKGYRWASSTTKTLRQIERIYIEVKYRAYNQEKVFELPIFDGISYNDSSTYVKKVTQVNETINKFHDIITI